MRCHIVVLDVQCLAVHEHLAQSTVKSWQLIHSMLVHSTQFAQMPLSCTEVAAPSFQGMSSVAALIATEGLSEKAA